MKQHGFEQSAWSLGALLPAHEGEGFDQILAQLDEQIGIFEGGRDRLAGDITTGAFLEMMALSEAIHATLRRLLVYARLWFAQDTQAEDALGFMGQM